MKYIFSVRRNVRHRHVPIPPRFDPMSARLGKMRIPVFFVPALTDFILKASMRQPSPRTSFPNKTLGADVIRQTGVEKRGENDRDRHADNPVFGRQDCEPPHAAALFWLVDESRRSGAIRSPTLNPAAGAGDPDRLLPPETYQSAFRSVRRRHSWSNRSGFIRFNHVAGFPDRIARLKLFAHSQAALPNHSAHGQPP